MARNEQTDPEALDLRQKIVGLMEDHAVSPLLETILEYLRKYPKSEWGWLVAAPTLIDLGRYGDAKAALANAREYGTTENLPAVCYWRCVLHKERGDLKRAERWIRRALKHDDSNGAHWVTLGDVLAKRGNPRPRARRSSRQLPWARAAQMRPTIIWPCSCARSVTMKGRWLRSPGPWPLIRTTPRRMHCGAIWMPCGRAPGDARKGRKAYPACGNIPGIGV